MEKKVTLIIGGMHCASCAHTIEQGLRKLDGVRDATVNFSNENAVVLYDPRRAAPGAMKRVVEENGFQFLGMGSREGPAALDARRDRALKDLRRKWIVGLCAGFPLMLAGMAKTGISPALMTWGMFLIATPVFVYTGAYIFRAALSSLRHLNLTMDVMYAMGMAASYGASLLSLIGILPSHEFMFFDTAVLLAAFLSLGRYLEARARRNTFSAIRALMKLRPQRATIIDNGVEREVPAGAVTPGDILIVKPGDAVPVDGEITEGESFVDQSMISGEALPVAKRKGGRVIAGTINKTGVLTFVATAVGEETSLARIIELVRNAQDSKMPAQEIADSAIRRFIPVVLFLAGAALVLWHFVFGAPMLFALTACISILVIACPCALGLATPTAVAVGVGRAAQLGILIKNGKAFEQSGKVGTVVFDKTGTLTEGTPRLTDCIPGSLDAHRLMTVAASLEKHSRHPLAGAVVEKAGALGCSPVACSGFTTLEGRGVVGVIEGKEALVGSAAFLVERKIPLGPRDEETARALADEGKTLLFVGFDGALGGSIACADVIRPSAAGAIALLGKMGVDAAMITGDNEKTALAIARQAGISRVMAGVLPAEKALKVKEMQRAGQCVAFVGDGINDAVALSQADIGIAPAAGTDIAMESGDVVLMRDNLWDVPAFLQLGRRVKRQIRINIFWAFAYNAVLLPFAAGVFYPLLHVMVRPEWAGLAMALSSVTVVSLSLSIRGFSPMVEAPGKAIGSGG